MFSSIQFICRNLINKALSFIKKKIIGLEPAKQEVDILTLIAVLAITVPLSAFMYWRLLCEDFGREYFQFCFSMEDIPYLLYDKGTFCWFIILILAIPSILLLFIKDRILKILYSLLLFFIVGFSLVKAGEFDITQVLVYGMLIIFTNFYIYFHNRRALYVYTIIIGIFFSISAKNDSKNAKRHPIRTTIVLKSGKSIINKNDTSKVYVRSTSKFVLIYDKKKDILHKFLRDSIL